MLGISKLAVIVLLLVFLMSSARRRPKQAIGKNEEDTNVLDDDESDEGGEKSKKFEALKQNQKTKRKSKSVTDYLQPPTELNPKAEELPRGFSAYFEEENFEADDFLNAHHIYLKDSEKHFPQLEILSYVTPWNRKGKIHAQAMSHKLNWVSPCWYQIRRKQDSNSEIEITVRHDEDWDWISSLYSEEGSDGQCRQDLRIVPRVVLETSLEGEKDIEMVQKRLLEVMEQANSKVTKPGMKCIHGFTLEIPLQETSIAIELPKSLKRAMPDIYIVMVLPPLEVSPRDKNTVHVLEALSVSVDRFSLMTYDANRDGSPHAPIEWVSRTVQGLMLAQSLKDKLLLGLPHYGWRSGGEDMTAEKMVLWLAKGQAIGKFDKVSQEHYFTDKYGKRSSFPSPEMLRRRLQLAVDLGIPGVAIWELGQGSAAFIEVY